MEMPKVDAAEWKKQPSGLEIWDATAWASYLEQQEDAFSDASEEVLPGVL